MEQAPEPPSVDELIDELKRRVEQREREGLYPTELVNDLQEHFRRIAAHRSSTDLDDVRTRLQALDGAARFSPAKIPVESGVAGGAKFHALVGRLVARQTQGILEQVQQFADTLRLVLHAMAHAIEQPHSHVHADLVGQIDALYEQLATLERGPADAAAVVAGLRERMRVLEDAERLRRFEPFYSRDRFEEAFRGTRDDLLGRYRDLATRLRDCGPVLDIGCGRGEFLELLGAEGIDARGVELDATLAEECRTRGFDVEHGDGLDVLRMLEDDSLGGLSLIQVVEHLTPQETVELVLLAADKLRPGGRMILETVNPQSLYVYAHALYLDPEHSRPVHPAYLTFVVREAGFSGVEIDWRSDPVATEVLDEVEADDAVGKTINENVRRLNTLLFAPQDYALIAVR